MSITRFTKKIPSKLALTYLNDGWTQNENLFPGSKSEDHIFVERSIQTRRVVDEIIHIGLERPRHIQRARINRPLGKFVDFPLGHAVKYDYMGNAHFEHGALALALRKIQVQFMQYKTYVLDELSEDHAGKTFNLRVFANFDSDDDRVEYTKYLLDVRNGTFYMEENAYFKLNVGDQDRPDVWFDIINGFIFSFDKQFMTRLPGHLKASFEMLDEQVEA